MSIMSHKDILLHIKIVCSVIFCYLFSFCTFDIKMWVLSLSKCICILFLTADYSKDFSKTMVSTVSIAMNPVRSLQFQEELWYIKTKIKKHRKEIKHSSAEKREKKKRRENRNLHCVIEPICIIFVPCL